MKKCLFFLLICAAGVTHAQRSKKSSSPSTPQSHADSIKVESLLIEAAKYQMIENNAKALESLFEAQKLNSESAAIFHKISEILEESDQGKKALPYGLKAIALAPENVHYRLSLARIYVEVGFYIEAAKTYKALLARHPSNENALYELAELYQLTGQQEEMFLTFDLIEAALGVREEIVRERQRILMKEGKLQEVMKEYEKLIDTYPNEMAYRIEYIGFLITNNRLAEASQEISAYEVYVPASSRVVLMKSEVAWLQGDHETSLALLEQAFETPAIDFESKFQILSNFFMASGSGSDHAALSRLAIQLARNYPQEFGAQAFVADLIYGGGQKKEALAFYLQAVSLKPASFSVWQNILNIEGELGMTDSLVVHAEKALEYFPNQALLYYFAGTAHLIKKNYKRSTRMLESGKKYTLDPQLLTLLYGQLGDAYNGLEDNEKSFAAYEKALANNPNNDHVLNNYSYFLSLSRENLEKALTMSTQLVAQHPENPTYLDTHGWVLYVTEAYEEAEKYLKKAADLGEDGTVIEHYGDVLYRLDKKEEALSQWVRAREVGGASKWIDKKITDQKLYE